MRKLAPCTRGTSSRIHLCMYNIHIQTTSVPVFLSFHHSISARLLSLPLYIEDIFVLSNGFSNYPSNIFFFPRAVRQSCPRHARAVGTIITQRVYLHARARNDVRNIYIYREESFVFAAFYICLQFGGFFCRALVRCT